ncbi:MAG: Lrp/AsnC family transcriptional regulator [Ilumatobacter sp.]|nr:Lrp/AsnC family transcriptional regulator [Ilumatobacter sp.]
MFHLDDINRDLLDLLQADGRLSYREIGERIGLSAPAVTERIRKLEEAGVITGYRATIDYEKIGFPILCIIRLNATNLDRSTIDDVMRAIPEIIEANRVTGSESHVIRARVRSTAHLEELLELVTGHGTTVTNIVTSSPVPRRPMNLRKALAYVGDDD